MPVPQRLQVGDPDMTAFCRHQLKVVQPGECPADGFEPQSDELCEIASAKRKREFGGVLFALGELTGKPDQESAESPFCAAACGEQRSFLALQHDTRNQPMKLKADNTVLKNALHQMRVRHDAKDGILEGDLRFRVRARRGAGKADHIASQRNIRNPAYSIIALRNGF